MPRFCRAGDRGIPSFVWLLVKRTGLHRLCVRRWLYLGGNSQLTGTIPSGISALTKLQDLSVEWSSLSGTIPTTVVAMRNLGCASGCRDANAGKFPYGYCVWFLLVCIVRLQNGGPSTKLLQRHDYRVHVVNDAANVRSVRLTWYSTVQVAIAAC